MICLPFALLPLAFLGQQFEWGDLAIIGLLVLLEGVLSIDNALVLGLLAKRLPPEQRPRALSYGLIGAFVFRVLAIATASFLLRWTIVKFLGGAYLIFIAVKHLFFESPEEDGKLVLDASGQPVLVDVDTGGAAPEPARRLGLVAARRRSPSFWGTVAVIELTDVAFAVDSILAAMALAGSREEKLWVVITGGILGVVLMRFAAAIFVRLLERFPRFEVSAYLLVIVIGLKLLADWGLNGDWSAERNAWFAERLGGWSQTFDDLEVSRRKGVDRYEGWLDHHWPLTAGAMQRPPDGHQGVDHAGHASGIPHVPHLLDFHDPRRPESISFWAVMAICFAVGFIRTPNSETA